MKLANCIDMPGVYTRLSSSLPFIFEKCEIPNRFILPFKCWCHKLLISVNYFPALREWYTTECKGSANILNCANPLEETLINFKQLQLFEWQKTLDCHLLGIHKCQQIISRVWLWTISTPQLQRYCRISLKLLTGHHY